MVVATDPAGSVAAEIAGIDVYSVGTLDSALEDIVPILVWMEDSGAELGADSNSELEAVGTDTLASDASVTLLEICVPATDVLDSCTVEASVAGIEVSGVALVVPDAEGADSEEILGVGIFETAGMPVPLASGAVHGTFPVTVIT